MNRSFHGQSFMSRSFMSRSFMSRSFENKGILRIEVSCTEVVWVEVSWTKVLWVEVSWTKVLWVEVSSWEQFREKSYKSCLIFYEVYVTEDIARRTPDITLDIMEGAHKHIELMDLTAYIFRIHTHTQQGYTELKKADNRKQIC